MIPKLALAALVSLIVLIFVGATVRATGSGLGCPDWPTCWGQLIPPTSVDQIDPDKLDLEKFRRRAEDRGFDPETITRETILESFNATHTWIEFFNRLTSLPLGFASLALALFSFRARHHRRWIVVLSWASLINVGINAWLGAVVVRSGLKPGIITLHMALAFTLVMTLTTVIWLSRERPGGVIPPAQQGRLLGVTLVFFVCLLVEGLLGSQVREQTDVLAKTFEGDRATWTAELHTSTIYLVHRSFSWSLLIAAGLIALWARAAEHKGPREPTAILALVILMAIMGVILGHIAILPQLQVLHVGTTAVLLAVTWRWVLRLLSDRPSSPASSASVPPAVS